MSKWNFPLPEDYYDCERGNTWLMNDDLHVAWFQLDANHFLEVAVEPCNYPGFKVAVIKETEAELAQHINAKCQGWAIKKCNINGVNKEGDTIALLDEDDSSSRPSC